MLASQLCNQNRMQTARYVAWCRRMQEVPRYHRKQWEFVYIAEALAERGMLAPGRRGLGFGVGREPMPALFASYGCEVVATDLSDADAKTSRWLDSGQHARGLSTLNDRGICGPAAFRRLVSFRSVDMNRIPDDLEHFDFLWSACALEHVGSLDFASEFIRKSLRCLRPGGVAVHTTEFNLNSNTDTVRTGGTVLFRRRDIEALAVRLSLEGHEISLDLEAGDGPADFYVDSPPYCEAPHLRLQLGSYVCTSVGLIVRNAGAARGPAVSYPQAAKAIAPHGHESGASLPARLYAGERLAVALTSDTALALAHGRLPILVDTRDSCAAPDLLLNGFWKLAEAELFCHIVRPGMTVVDVGPGYGYFSLLAADAVGESGRVHAVEADGRRAELLERSVELNRFENIVSVHRCSMSANPPPDVLPAARNRAGKSGLRAKEARISEGGAAGPGKRLDELISGSVHVMRIDAGGHEPSVVQGMSRVLRRSPGIQILLEFAPGRIRDSGLDPAEFLRNLRHIGFLWRAVNAEGPLTDCGDDRLLEGCSSTLYMTLE